MKTSLRSCGMLALAVVAAACGNGQTLTSPSVTGGMLPGALSSTPGASSPLELRTLTGRFIDVLTGAAASGVTMNIAGVGDVAGDAAGRFSLDTEAPDGSYRVAVSGAGVVPRQASLTLSTEAPTISLIPGTFNMTAFDQMVRQFGQHAGIMKRWTQMPALVIETSLVDPGSVVAGVPQYPAVASAEQLSEASINEVVAHLARALPLMTGENFPAFVTIERSTTAPGAVIDMERPGTITVARYAGLNQLCQGYTYFFYGESFTALASGLFLQTCGQVAGAAPLSYVVAHELGHALGYGHVSAAPSVMTATVFSDVTEFDRQAAVIAFQRAPGNQAPDVDPDIPVAVPAVSLTGRTWTVGPIQ